MLTVCVCGPYPLSSVMSKDSAPFLIVKWKKVIQADSSSGFSTMLTRNGCTPRSHFNAYRAEPPATSVRFTPPGPSNPKEVAIGLNPVGMVGMSAPPVHGEVVGHGAAHAAVRLVPVRGDHLARLLDDSRAL